MNKSFDTETVNGLVVVAGYGDGDHQLYPTLDQFLEKVCQERSGRFFTWNIRFDCEMFLKKLPMENILELLEEDSKGTTYKKWWIHYFSNSSLIIKDLDTKRVVKVWDLARFYNYLRLEAAARMYLPKGEEKMTSDVIEYFKEPEGNTIEYFEQNKDEINKYCIQDARATKLLSDVFEQTCAEQGYDFKNPYSIGNLGIKFFKPFLVYGNKGYNIPRIHPCHFKYSNERLRKIEAVQDLLGRGGWNDCFKRGKFTEVWDADIVSAYPYFMQQAPYWDGDWIATENESELEEYTYGHVSCQIRNLDIPMLPSVYQYFNESEIFGDTVKWENHSVIWSTVGDNWNGVMLPLPMYKYIRSHADIKFEVATYLKPTEGYEDYFPLKKPIEVLFERKRKAKKGSVEYNLAKILMNGTSGKFKQRMHSDNTWFFYPHLYGKITWDVKAMVLDLIIENDLWEDLVSVSTDGAVFRSKPSKIVVEKKLGGWDLERFSPFVQVGNGIYYGTLDNGDPIYRLRGFNMGKTDKKLQQWIEGNPTKSVIKLKTTRPLHLRECVKHHKVLKVEDVGKFVDIHKRLNINQEIKRNWNGQKFQDIAEMLSGRVLESTSWDFTVANEMAKKQNKRIKRELKEMEENEAKC
jgi:uncharacterized protein YeeX (DUF496 family)